MERRHSTPREEFLAKIWTISLVNPQVNFEQITHRPGLKLSGPLSVLAQPSAIFIKIFVINNEELVLISVVFDISHCLLPVLLVLILVSIELISDRSEETVAVPAHLFDFQLVPR